MKPIDEMTHEELETYARFTAGLSPAEIKKDFKNDEALRAFLKEAQQFRGAVIDEAVETKVGWDETDETKPDDEINKKKAKKRAALQKSIKATGGKVSVNDVQRALAALEEDDDDE